MNKINEKTLAQEDAPLTKQPDGTLNWPYEVIAFHDCVDYPHLPCPACLNEEHEESLKKQG
jgi:hypothetical protein